MKPASVVPAQWDFNDRGLPYSPIYGDVYHPRVDAVEQARQVFLGGNELPARWRGRESYVVLETGFGLGNNFLATWDAWRQDDRRCNRLHYLAIERHPLTRADLSRVHERSPLRPLADQLLAAWPPLTPDLHPLSFEDGKVRLLLALGDAAAWMGELQAQVDAFCLDGFAPACNPDMWQPRLFKAMARMAAPGATVATWTAATSVREGLQGAGFEVLPAAGSGGQRDITQARFAPRFVPRPAGAPPEALRAGAGIGNVPRDLPGSTATVRPGSPGRVLILGAGLAGCATAWALAALGVTSTVIDRHALPAQEASGNPAGIFHGTVNPQDGAHARFNRAAALVAQRTIGHWISEGRIPGSERGVLRLEPRAVDASAMRQQLRDLGLPPDYVEAVDAGRASALSGLSLPHPAWFYPGGGWVDPGALARALLERAAGATQFRGSIRVESLQRTGDVWEVFDEHGARIDSARTVVLANAFDALRLVGSPAWDLSRVRGQISVCTRSEGLVLPGIPLAGMGYVLPRIGSAAVFGATADAGDDDPQVRLADHRHNLARLALLTGQSVDGVPLETLEGRTAWRMVSRDRLPLVGAMPDLDRVEALDASRLAQPRFVPRREGLYLLVGLGSRGITWSPLAAQVLAAVIHGSPLPLERSLTNAIDPARFISRAARRANTTRGSRG